MMKHRRLPHAVAVAVAWLPVLGVGSTSTQRLSDNMPGRKRPRPSSSVQLLAVTMTTFASRPSAIQGFLVSPSPWSRQKSFGPEVSCPHGRRLVTIPGTATIAATHIRSRPLQAAPDRQRGDSNSIGEDDPMGDPLPRTMGELYRQMRLNQSVESPSQDGTLTSADLEAMEEAVRDVFRPMEDEDWWEQHQEEWDEMSENPELAFTGMDNVPEKGKKGFVWGLESFFGGDEDSQDADSEYSALPYSLSAYKAGAGARAVGREGDGTLTGVGVRYGDLAFERTPFARYWDSLPDLRVTKRVYAFNAVDRMAALKYLMDCTYNGMHGPAETQQAGHFLWGYADQLDWMRRSGRLSSTPGSIKVDRGSWWGCVSYALTIAPLAAAVESGLWEEDSVSILHGGEDLQLPEMRRAVRAWRRVWRFNDADISKRVLLDMPVHDSLQERVRRAQWAAHLESLEAVEALYKKEFDALPSAAEREFARGWCRAARLLAVAAAHTNLDRLIFPLGAGYPPERILTDNAGGDTADYMAGELDSVPYGPPHLVEEATTDPVLALNTRRSVESVRWLGTLRASTFAVLCLLWQRSCTSYPSRLGAARALRRACYGGKRDKAKAWGRSLWYMFVPDLNYRKLAPPFGVDPAEEVEYDPDMELRDPAKPLPRPPGSRPLNPLQWPWYDGRRPDPRAVEGPDDNDDGFGAGSESMFPPGRVPGNIGFEALQRIDREIMEDLRRAKKRKEETEGGREHGGSSSQREGSVAKDNDGDTATSTVFM